MLNIAVTEAVPTARRARTVTVKPGLRRRSRSAKRASFRKWRIIPLPPPGEAAAEEARARRIERRRAIDREVARRLRMARRRLEESADAGARTGGRVERRGAARG